MIGARRELGGTLPGQPGHRPRDLFRLVGLDACQAIGEAFPVPAAGVSAPFPEQKEQKEQKG